MIDRLVARLFLKLLIEKVRDRNFRKSVLDAYDERCAITGLKLLNGGGRAEVSSCSYQISRNTMAPTLSATGWLFRETAHWMFDRGLVGLTAELEICVSRQANDQDAVKSLINQTGKFDDTDAPCEPTKTGIC